MATLVAVTLTGVSCAALKTEFTKPTVDSPPPPIVAQLDAARPIVAGIVPEPWGSLVSGLMGLAATGAAAFATFHARRAAVASATAVNGTTPPAAPPV